MKRKVIVLVTLLILTLPLLSCSTVLSQNRSGLDFEQCSPPPYVYGGVILDVVILWAIVSYDEDSDPLGHAIGSVFAVVYVAVDLPFSLVADTIILPLSIYRDISECFLKPKTKTDEEVADDMLKIGTSQRPHWVVAAFSRH